METREIILKKSELAKLKGAGFNHEMVAEKFGVKESEIKDAMMTFGLSKAKPKAKKEAEYKIVLENDMEDAPVKEKTSSTEADASTTGAPSVEF